MLTKLQQEHSKWSRRNFGERSADDSLFGVMEEVGELSHAHLKQKQGIRLNEDHESNAKDAVGDIFIYLVSYCTSREWSFEDIVKETWNEVKQRDWIKYPKDGRTK